ncbi:MAG: metallophosphoesterase family protein [Armatimonadota bacterium]
MAEITGRHQQKYAGRIAHREMLTFSILHMGDLHYPKRKPRVDDKRHLLSEASVHSSSIDELRSAKLGLPKIIQNAPPDLLLFSGDVTDATDKTPSGLTKGCLYLHELWSDMSLGPGITSPAIGNHDVVRDAGTDKFKAVEDQWNGLSYSLAVEKPDDRTIRIANGIQIPLYSLNSCHGAGETHQYPDAVDGAIRRLLEEGQPEDQQKAKDALYDFLDVPIIKTSEIDQIAAETRDAGIVILQAHHNILPQMVARLAVSPEMTTAGYLRRKLLGTGKAVIYFHGHTHTPITEVVRDGNRPEAALVSIGVDEFPNGFNFVRLLLSDEGRAIAVRVRRYTLARDSYEYEEIGHSDICLLPFWHRKKYLSVAGKALLDAQRDLFRRDMRFTEISAIVPEALPEHVVEQIDLLCALEYATVLNPIDPAPQWVVQWTE